MTGGVVDPTRPPGEPGARYICPGVRFGWNARVSRCLWRRTSGKDFDQLPMLGGPTAVGLAVKETTRTSKATVGTTLVDVVVTHTAPIARLGYGTIQGVQIPQAEGHSL
jgi:hypothetical protein